MRLRNGLSLLLISLAYADAGHSGWQVQQRAPPNATITLHIGLAASDGFAGLRQAAASIADPVNERYRKHLGVEELQVLLKAQPSAAASVSVWLQDAGVSLPAMQQKGNVLDATMTVRQAEKLLQTEYSIFTDGWMDIIRSSKDYNLPDHLQDSIEFVAPTDTFPKPSEHKPQDDISRRGSMHVKRQSQSCGSNDVSSPACIRRVYNITYTPGPNRTTFGVYATEAAGVLNATDVHTFLETYNKPAADANAQYQIVGDGDSANGAPSIEAAFEISLDTQTFIGLAWPVPGIFYNLGGVFGPANNNSVDAAGQRYTTYDTYDPFIRFLQELMHNETVPSLVSFSQSWSENQVNEGYARSVCTMMQAIGARGVTLVFSAGNNGAQGNQPDQIHLDVFEPKFPASCPYVTSVGGTTDLAAETAATQQTVTGVINKASLIASGGGFSNYFARPDYQNTTVPAYIQNHIPSSYHNLSGFNASGRGIPDISAFSTSFPTFVNGSSIPVGGTSAAAPVWAAIITLLNDYEISRGRPTLGFINPWLYSLPEGVLKDITAGGNNSGQCLNCTFTQTPGYDVVEGWDPVTGLGSPMFNRLVDALEERAAGMNGTNGTSGTNSTNGSTSDAAASSATSLLMLLAVVLGLMWMS